MKVRTKTSLLIAIIAMVVFACAALFTACGETTVDKTELAARIEYVETNYANNEDGVYTEDSFADLVDALNAGKSVNADTNAKQSAVDEALKNLNDAIDSLQPTFVRAYDLYYLSDFVGAIRFNYTLNVTDYRSKTPAEYKAYYTENARYYENTGSGLVSYDGYVHHWSYDDEGNVEMGRVYFKTNATPMVYLYGDEMSRIIRSLGNIDDYEIYASADFANLKNTNIYISTSEIYIEAFFEVATGEQIDDEIAELFGGVSLEIKTVDGNEVLEVTMWGNNYLDPVIVYTVTDEGTTALDEVAEYVEENPAYTTAVDVTGLLEEFWDVYYWEEAVRFDVYTRGMDNPDYTVTFSDMDHTYWYSTKSNAALLNLSGAKLTQAQIGEDGTIAFGQEASFNMYGVSFNTYVVQKSDLYLNVAGTDEYFIDLKANSGVLDFVTRFFDVDAEDAKYISKVSLTVNEDGKLVVTLWEDYSTSVKAWDGVLLRAVLTESTYTDDEVTVQAIEDYYAALDSLEALQKAIQQAEAISPAQYTTESYQALQDAIEAAKTVVANENRTSEEVAEANTNLTLAKSALVKSVTDEELAALTNIIIKAGLYTQAKYTEESYAVLQAAVDAGNELLEGSDLSGTDVEEKVNAISAAIDRLVLAVDKTALAARISELGSEDVKGYTKKSASAFQSALSSAALVSATASATQAEVDSALDALNAAFAALELLAESEQLTALQEGYTALSSVNNGEGTYTAESFAAFEAVRAKVAEVLEDGDLSDEDCIALLKMLNSRYDELESADSELIETTSSAITTFLKSGTSFRLTFEDGSTANIYYKANSYYYSEVANTGYVLFEKFVHSFTVVDGRVELGDPVVGKSGYIAYYFTHINYAVPFGNFRYTMTRIYDTNEWFVADTAWLSCLPAVEGAYGYSLELNGSTLIVRVYGGKNLLDDSMAGRTEVLCTYKIEKLTTTTYDIVETFLAKDAPMASQEDILSALQEIGNNYTIVNVRYGTQIVRTSKYYFDGNSGYILKRGKVYELFLIEGEYKVGGVVYVNNEVATSIDQVAPSFAELQALTEEDLEQFYDDWYEVYLSISYYLVSGGNADLDLNELMAKLAGIEADEDGEYPDMCISINANGEIYLVKGDMTMLNTLMNIFIVTSVGTTSVAELEQLAR